MYYNTQINHSVRRVELIDILRFTSHLDERRQHKLCRTEIAFVRSFFSVFTAVNFRSLCLELDSMFQEKGKCRYCSYLRHFHKFLLRIIAIQWLSTFFIRGLSFQGGNNFWTYH